MLNKLISSIATVSTSLTNCGAPSSFKFVINEKIEFPNALFELYNGKPKHGAISIPGLPIGDMARLDVSVFVFRKSGGEAASAAFAATAMKKLVSLRHPSILRVLDSGENENGVYIATEHVVPLTLVPRSKSIPMHALYQLAKGIEFIHTEAKLVHGSVDPINVFVTDSGGFRLGGFELARPVIDSNYYYDRRNLAAGTFRRIDCRDVADADTFGFVLVCHYLGHGPAIPAGLDGSVTLNSLIDAVAKAAEEPGLRQLLAELNRSRAVTATLPVFSGNETVQIFEFFESLHLHGDEAVRFLESLPLRLPRVDRHFQQGVLIDLLLNSVISISSLVPAAIPVIAAIASDMPKDAFRLRVQTKLVELFAVQDRSIRFRLLTALPSLVTQFEESVLEKSVLIETLSGFTDSHPSIREMTLRSVVDIAKHIGRGGVEKRVVPPLTKLLKDPEASIRTNAIVAIAKVAALIPDEQKQTEIISLAVLAGLRDSVNSARLVALQTFQTLPVKTATEAREVSEKFLPLICPLMTEGDAQVCNLAVDVLESALVDIKRHLPSRPTVAAAKAPEISFPSFHTSSSAPAPPPAVFPPAEPVLQTNMQSSTQSRAGMALSGKSSGISDLAGFADFAKPAPASLPTVPMMSTGVKKKTEDFDSFWDDIQSPAAKPSPGNSLI